MSEAIVVALIMSGFTLIGTFVNSYVQAKKAKMEQDARQALNEQKLQAFMVATNEKIEALTVECRAHNKVKDRMYSAEQNIAVIQEQIKVGNHRIDDLERKVS